MKALLGINGKKGHGKDALGTAIVKAAQERGISAMHCNLADPLKDQLAYAVAYWYENPTGLYYSELLEKAKLDMETSENTWEPFVFWLVEKFDMTPQQATAAALVLVARALGDHDDPSGEAPEVNQALKQTYLDQMNDPEEKKSWRVGMQWWGTEFRRRMCGDGYWRDLFRMVASTAPVDLVVCTDPRFPDEKTLFESMGGHVGRIVRSSVPVDSDAHSSETALDHLSPSDFAFWVDNAGTLDDLRVVAESLLSQYLPAA